jgi:iron complex outermembrane receptor protein
MSFGISGTSFNGYKGKIRYADQVEKHKLQAYSSYQRTDSYRKQSALERQILFLKDRFRYSEKGEVGLLFLNSNLHYETPGGLTLAQMQADPRQARPKTAVLPGAQEQQAGIYNRMVLGGISHIYEFVPHLSHYISVQGSYNDFKNPFITNFEQRYERNFAVRTHLNFDKSSAANFYQTRVGFEAGTNTSRIRNFDNNGGIPGNSQNHDDLFTESGYLFLAQKAEFSARLFVDGSLSLNLMKYRWNRFFPNDFSGTKTLERELLPGFAVSYLLAQGLSVRGKISKGNSAPTMEELRSSTQEINENLYPEFGWNREVGLRKQFGNFLYLEASLFDFRLKQAIVRRQTEEGQEYFVNAGETVQRGIEAVAETKVFSFRNPVLKSLKFWFSGSFYDFKFKDYRQNENDYSGNRLTGVPKTSLQSLINLKFGKNIRLDLTHFYVSEIPLNDSNSVSADPSLVGNVTLRYPLITGDFKVNFSVSIMNVYDARYSLGHDINAFGNRFYNPAAGRNVMAGADFYFK